MPDPSPIFFMALSTLGSGVLIALYQIISLSREQEKARQPVRTHDDQPHRR